MYGCENDQITQEMGGFTRNPSSVSKGLELITEMDAAGVYCGVLAADFLTVQCAHAVQRMF
jgi:hypothetical protein